MLVRAPALLGLAPCGAHVASVQGLRSAPSAAVHGLHILAKPRLGIPDLKRLDLRVPEHGTGEDDGPFPATAVAAVSRPARMPGPDDSHQVDSVLDEIHQQSLFLLGRKIAHKHQAGDAYRPAHLAAVVRHVLSGHIEVEREMSIHGRWKRSAHSWGSALLTQPASPGGPSVGGSRGSRSRRRFLAR